MWQKSIIAFCAVCNSSLVDNYILFCGMAFSVMAFTLRHGSHRCTLTHKHQCIELLSTSWFSMVLNVNSLSPGASMHICRIVKRRKKKKTKWICSFDAMFGVEFAKAMSVLLPANNGEWQAYAYSIAEHLLSAYLRPFCSIPNKTYFSNKSIVHVAVFIPFDTLQMPRVFSGGRKRAIAIEWVG